MTEQDVRRIIREELQTLFKTDRITFEKNIQILDARNIQLGRTNGTQIGTATDQKLGFYGKTPIVQPSTLGDPTGLGTEGVDTPARTTIGQIIDLLQSLGLMA